VKWPNTTSDTAVFSDVGGTVSMNDVNAGGITFANPSATGYALKGVGGDGTNTLTLGNGGVIQTLAADGAHVNTFTTKIKLTGATATFSSNSANSTMQIGHKTDKWLTTSASLTTLTLNGTNTGINRLGGAEEGVTTAIVNNAAIAIVKDGPGTWWLSGKLLSKGVTIKEGTLVFSHHNDALGRNGVTLGNSDGGAYDATLVSGSTGLTAGYLITLAANTTGTLTVGGGAGIAATTYSGGVTGANDLSLDSRGTLLTMSGAAVNNTGALTVKGAGNTDISSVIGSNVTGLTKNDDGKLTLSAANAYTGTTIINGGKLQLNNNQACQYSVIDTSGAGVIVLSGATAPIFGGLQGSKDIYLALITAGYPSVTGLTLNPGAGVSRDYSGIIADGAASTTLTKTGAGTQILSGANAYTGATTVNAGTLVISGSPTGNSAVVVNAGTLVISGSPTGNSAVAVKGGTLKLDYSTLDTGKINDLAVLTLGGGTVELAGDGVGDPVEVVASTTLAPGASTVTRSSGAAVLAMGAITSAGGIVNFGAENIATTTNTNDATGILGPWATIGDNWARNDGSGNIVAYTAGYTDIDARGGGANPDIVDGSATNVRIQSDGMSGAIGLSAETTTVNTLLQSNATYAATIDTAGKTLATGVIMIGSVAEALTVGASAGDGVLKTAAAGGNLILINNNPAKKLTVNAAIADNETSGLSTAGNVLLNGANTYTGATTVIAGILQAGVASVADVSGAFGKNSAVTMGNVSGATLDLNTFDTQIGSLTGGGANGGNVTLGAASLTVGGDNTSPAAYAGVISSTGSPTTSLVKIGSGTLILTGANTYTGQTTVSNGTLQLGDGTANGAVTSGLYQLATGATLYLNNATAVAAAPGGYTTLVRGSGTLRLNSQQPVDGSAGWGSGVTAPFNAAFTGTLRVDKGRFESNVAGLGGMTKIVIKSGGQFLTVGTGQTFTQNFELAGSGHGETGFPGALRVGDAATATFTGNITLTANASLNVQATTSSMTINGSISGGFGITKEGDGPLVLNGTNDYGGSTTIKKGIITANNDSAFGPTGAVVFNGGRRLVVGNGVTIANPITMGANDGETSRGLIEPTSGGYATVSGPITINKAAANGGHFASAGGGILTITGPITSSVEPVVVRAGTVKLSGGGTGYTDLQIGGTVMIGADDGISTTAALTIGKSADGTLDLNGFNQTVVGVTKGSQASIIGNSSITSDSTLTTTGTSSFAGIIRNAVGSGTRKVNLTVNGGALTLTGANTYTGATTVSAGKLLVNGSLAAGSAVTVNGGALGGTGTIGGAVTANAGGKIAPGASVGTLKVGTVSVPGSVAMAANSIYEWEFDGAADCVAIQGDLFLAAGWKISLLDAGTSGIKPAFGSEYDLFTYTGTFSGSLAGIIDDSAVPSWPDAVVGQDATPGAGRIYLKFAIPGDTNDDQVVDAADFINLKKNFGTSTGAGWPRATSTAATRSTGPT
jgi:autotransporter-associated beta strand protein